jgi:crotonobetainyl-CoA:carnitine CoA-transferase CaiB-like acyl-CoA transferase
VTLNLRTEAGKGLLRELIAVSDVVTENFAPGVLERLGFPYEEMRAIKEDIVCVSNSGFGQTGPYRRFKTWGPLAQACCGLTFSTGLAGQPATGIGYSYMDHQGANFMVIAVLAGLRHRDRTGEGQWIDISCTDAGALLNGPALLDYSVNGRASRRPGAPDSNHCQQRMVPHSIYPARGEDCWVAIACRDDEDWQRLAAFVGLPWALALRFASLATRFAGQDELDQLLGEWTSGQDRFELAQALRQAGVPASAVQRPAERIDHDPLTAGWGLWPSVTHTEMGKVRVDGIPVHFSQTDWVIDRPAPCLGEHNEIVFGGLLGHSLEELSELTEAGVL